MKKDIVVAFYKHTDTKDRFFLNLVRKSIQFWTKSKYYHTEFMIDRYWYSARAKKGLVRFNIRKFNPKYDYFIVKVDVCKSQDKKIISFLESVVGEPYDFEGIAFRQFINVGSQGANSWFCSEITSKINQLYLVDEFIKVESSTQDPGDVYKKLEKSKYATKITADELNRIYF